MSDVSYLSDRIAYKKTDEDLTVYIRAASRSDEKKLRMLKAWVIAWSICGLLIFVQLFLPFYTADEKLYFLIYLSFWAYFEYRVAAAYYFRRYGTETIYLNNDKFMIRRDVHNRKGKPQHFKAVVKNPFTIPADQPTGWAKHFYNSFWVTTGNSIAFGNKPKEYRFGVQLSEKESKSLVRLLNASIHTEKKKA